MLGGNKINELIQFFCHLFDSDEDGFDIIVDRSTLTFSSLRSDYSFCIKTKQNFVLTSERYKVYYKCKI